MNEVDQGLLAQLDDTVSIARNNAKNPPTIEQFVTGHGPETEAKLRKTIELGLRFGTLYLDEKGRVRVPGLPEPEDFPPIADEEIALRLDEESLT